MNEWGGEHLGCELESTGLVNGILLLDLGEWKVTAPFWSRELGLPAAPLLEVTHFRHVLQPKRKERGVERGREEKIVKQDFQPMLKCKCP